MYCYLVLAKVKSVQFLYLYMHVHNFFFQDLYSVMIKGPKRTPYEDGLFFFDFQFPADYPKVPPLCHYISYCSDRLNPNLYEGGKVCVSLLGTWGGKVILTTLLILHLNSKIYKTFYYCLVKSFMLNQICKILRLFFLMLHELGSNFLIRFC